MPRRRPTYRYSDHARAEDVSRDSLRCRNTPTLTRFFSAVRSEHTKRYRFDQPFLGWVGRGLSFTKDDSQTLVPFFC
jgi:hypothetical protein